MAEPRSARCRIASRRRSTVQGLSVLESKNQRRQFEQMYDVIDIYQEAARTDPDIADAMGTIMANRERAFRRHIEAIAAHLAPRPDRR
jgi:hypothetical protein